MSCATPILPSGPLDNVPEMPGHVAEIAGHDPEKAGHVHPKYAEVIEHQDGCRVLVEGIGLDGWRRRFLVKSEKICSHYVNCFSDF